MSTPTTTPTPTTKGPTMPDPLTRLAGMAEVSSPASQRENGGEDSPGAAFLRRIAEAAEAAPGDYGESLYDRDGVNPDTVHEMADSLAPIYTYDRWQVFTDLALWNEDVTEYGPVEDMTDAAGLACYMVAERLLNVLLADGEA